MHGSARRGQRHGGTAARGGTPRGVGWVGLLALLVAVALAGCDHLAHTPHDAALTPPPGAAASVVLQATHLP